MQVVSAIASISKYITSMPGGRPSNSKRPLFGERLFETREERGLSQAQVADKLGIAQQSYAAWERRTTALRPEQLIQLAELFGTTVDFLVGYKSTPKRKGGPVGRVNQVFEQVSKLPRHHQQKILDVVEALIAQQSSRAHSA